ncbi:MAG: AAA family ATPase, partial [Gammaproteobacteria bacterium]|nr:AAA family ATPase [Gammaproteobacteria bacterium]
MPTPSPPIPYGWSDFALMRRERSLYVDKTRFLRELEDERFAFLIRPRRFGKSCWVSILEHYYDRWRKTNFEAVFAGTDIGQAPTANRSRYVILRFDFSAFEDTPETLRDRFETYCHIKLRGALERNKDLIPAQLHQRFLEPPTIDSKLNELFDYAGNQGIPLYVLIDEYDNFANNVLAHRGAEAYHSFTHGSG